MDRGAWWATAYGVAKSLKRLSMDRGTQRRPPAIPPVFLYLGIILGVPLNSLGKQWRNPREIQLSMCYNVFFPIQNKQGHPKLKLTILTGFTHHLRKSLTLNTGLNSNLSEQKSLHLNWFSDFHT